ncbi:competence/damage-inducible protein A [Mariniblastus fucicola]|uniref:CinA-like protein n=1 Tax=Mariniblastus fucicola TaxID=980251 RepID=A0A5B9P3Y6_9BACT|nr:CinA family nicotinamide mononucleotide deamidase-related protein [Mariniblastus fucicola]QEG21317.1 NMN amidohydrolase-like protein YfaY [Mariniblastus fucicola]
MKQSTSPVAEIIAVGDEMTSGQRIDTNSAWLARQLNDLGIEVAYHSTVGDDLQRQTEIIRAAMQRANIVLMTGGLGPTKDDLTRQAIADAAGVELEIDEAALVHIESIFARFKREMSPANRRQAEFPRGGKTIHNEEGTAPGVDFSSGNSRVFAMPGVPYEMKLMWESYIEPEVRDRCASAKTIRHHVLRSFGVGESQAESMMPDLMARDRQPRVGITASMSIISFRITAMADTEDECKTQIDSTVAYIRETLGEVVFGENEDLLSAVTADLLLTHDLSVSMADFQFGSAAASLLREGFPDSQRRTLRHASSIDGQTPQQWLADESLLDVAAVELAATRIREQHGTRIGVAIGKLISDEGDSSSGKFPVAISIEGEAKPIMETFRYGGHSSMRMTRSANQVVNFIRLTLLRRRQRTQLATE